MPLRNLIIVLLSAVISLACYEKAQRNRYAATINEAMHIISQQFVEEVEPRDLFESAMDGMVDGLDQYSSFISPDDFSQFQETLDQKFGGIGIIVELSPDTKRLTVMSPLVDTPAYEAGMRAGDTILEIDGNSTVEMTLKDAVGLMRGLPGTPIQVTIVHAGQSQPIPMTLKRAIIPIESVLGDTRQQDGSWNFYLEQHPRIGYVRITTFGEKTAEELRKATQFKNQSVDAVIIDLRSNAGGLLTAAVDTCDMFIDSGRIVSTRGRSGVVRRVYDAGPSGTALPTDVPMVVLINGYSASASEIVAACLQDHQRAVVVGQRSWGKGTVQNIIELEGGKSALKLTTATYWRPSGNNIHRRKNVGEDEDWGVRPNDSFEVVLSDEEFQRVVKIRRRRDVLRHGDVKSVSGAKRRDGEKSGSDAGDEKTGDEKTGDEKTGDEKTGDEKTGDEKTGDEKTGDEKTGDEKTGDEKTGDEKAGDEKAGDEKTGDEKAGDEKAGDEKGKTDPKASGDRPGPSDDVDFFDPQLDRAIEYLEERLKQRDALGTKA